VTQRTGSGTIASGAKIGINTTPRKDRGQRSLPGREFYGDLTRQLLADRLFWNRSSSSTNANARG
jgi:hypothetical protein